MVDQELLEILCCPESKQSLSVADDKLVAEINEKIKAGSLINIIGDSITEEIDGGLIREDGVLLYPVREGIPVMLVDEAIALEQ